MIKKWNQFINESKADNMVQRKISLLTDLSTDLTDLGLEINIWSGSKNGSDKAEEKYIVMIIDDDKNAVLDDGGYYKNRLKEKQEIKDFFEKLKSFGFIPSVVDDFNNSRVFAYFLKTGKTTKTPLLY